MSCGVFNCEQLSPHDVIRYLRSFFSFPSGTASDAELNPINTNEISLGTTNPFVEGKFLNIQQSIII